MFLLASLLSTLALADDVVPGASTAPAKVTFATTGGEAMTVRVIEGHASGTGYAAGTTVTMTTTFYKDLCQTPCSAEMDAGLRSLSFFGGGYTPIGGTWDLKPGMTSVITVDGGSLALHRASLAGSWLGFLAATTGGVILLAIPSGTPDAAERLTGPSKGLIGGGVALLAVGITGGVLTRSHVSIEQTAGP